ncbi:MAG: response regulator transcription factor [Granulosicoccaceae bacterium]
MSKILLADDDQLLADLLVEYLQSQNFEVQHVGDGQAAVEAVSAQPPELVILDVMMPVMDGFEALREIRAKSMVPIIMLTARGDDIDRIVGLEMGADDYMPKPCNPRELTARIRAILRRTGGEANAAEDAGTLTASDLTLDTHSRVVTCANRKLDLTSTEFNVLHTLLQQAGEVVSKNTLSEAALGRKLLPFDRSTDMHISNLRKKLGEHPNGEARIKTVRNQGYIYTLASEVS